MTRNSSAREDVLPEKEGTDLEADLGDNSSPLASCLDGGGAAATDEHLKKGSKLTNRMSQAVWMFRKLLLPETRNNMWKTSVEVQEATSRTRSEVHFSPLKLSNMPRGPTLLEQSILQGIRSDGSDAIGSASDGNCSASQLTIFYAGVINVYDNVPVEKAKDIMLLAGKSSLSKPVAVGVPETENKKPLAHSHMLPSSRSQAGLPIARKTSLQHFFERRRHRITSKSPYSHQRAEGKKTEPVKDEGSDKNHHGIPLSPFPSRSGFLG